MNAAARHIESPDTIAVELSLDPHAVPTNRTVAATLHPRVLWLTAGAYATMILAFWIGFAGPRDSAIALGIVTVVLAAFLALPYILARAGKVTGGDGSTFRQFLDGYLATASGPVSGRGAVAMVIVVPVSLCMAAIAMAIIIAVLR